MNIAVVGHSPALNTSYGIQNGIWCNEIGKTHNVMMFPEKKTVGNPVHHGNYTIYPTSSRMFMDMRSKGEFDILYTHGDIQELSRFPSRTSNDYVWIARTPLDTEKYSESWKQLLSMPDMNVVESESSKKVFDGNGHHCTRIYPPISDAYTKFDPENCVVYDWRKKFFLMLFVARPHWRKNLPTVLAALKQLKDEGLPVKLFIHADFNDYAATKMDYSLLIHSLGIEDSIIMPNKLHYDQGIKEVTLASLYHASDVLVTPNLGEGFGITIAESMACGTPVIATEYTTGPELLGEDRGLLVDVDMIFDVDGIERPIPSVKSLVDNVKYYIDNPDEKDAHGEAGKEYARKTFSIEHIFNEWRNVIDSVSMNSITLQEDII